VNDVTIDQATVADWRAVKAIRLHALAEAPYAFGSNLAREQGFDDDEWRRRLEARTWFLARADGRPVGVTALIAEDDRPDERHLVSMWVEPDRRGTPVAANLVAAACRGARKADATSVTLWVADANPRARRFYARLGFVSTGERQPIRPNEPDVGEERLRLDLVRSQQPAQRGSSERSAAAE
jgi:GNAT superfamily N-acetyltransferase